MARNSESSVRAISGILARQGVISEGEATALVSGFERSAQEQFDDFLLDEGLVDENDLLAALSEHYKVPAVSVVGHFFDAQLLHLFSRPFLVRHMIIPLELKDNTLVIVAAYPSDENLGARIAEQVKYEISFRVGVARDIIDAVREFYDVSPATSSIKKK